MCLDFLFKELPLPLEFQRVACGRGMDIFWNHPYLDQRTAHLLDDWRNDIQQCKLIILTLIGTQPITNCKVIFSPSHIIKKLTSMVIMHSIYLEYSLSLKIHCSECSTVNLKPFVIVNKRHFCYLSISRLQCIIMCPVYFIIGVPNRFFRTQDLPYLKARTWDFERNGSNTYNEPFATNGHMVQNPPYWRASSLLFPHWDIKTKASQA